MKNDLDYKQILKSAGLAIWHSVSHRFWYKLMSVVIAVFIWSYAISSNPSLPRDKWVDVDIRVTGQSALSTRGYALLTDVSDLAPARVRVSVPQQAYQSVTAQNVGVELDLSTLRTTGTQQAKLRATTVLGSVVNIQPEFIELEVDRWDQRNVPVNVKLVNENPDYWPDKPGIDPSRITLSGPASIVRSISSARVDLDCEGIVDYEELALEPVFYDITGSEIPTQLLTQSATSVTIKLDVYPQKTLPVSALAEEVLPGELPEGYQIDAIEVEPEFITVAAEPELLDNLKSVQIAPIEASGETRQINAKTSVIKLNDAKHYSSDSVYVKVDIIESTTERTFTDHEVKLRNLDETRFRAKWSNPSVDIKVMDLYSIVNALTRDDLNVTVDLSQITEPGTYELPIIVRVDKNPELEYQVEPAVAMVTLSDIE